jgi:hypothetical protein
MSHIISLLDRHNTTDSARFDACSCSNAPTSPPAALAWLHETFARATSQSATAVIVSFHADPGFDWFPTDRSPFEPLLDAFEDEAGATPSFAFEQRLVPRWKYW